MACATVHFAFDWGVRLQVLRIYLRTFDQDLLKEKLCDMSTNGSAVLMAEADEYFWFRVSLNLIAKLFEEIAEPWL